MYVLFGSGYLDEAKDLVRLAQARILADGQEFQMEASANEELPVAGKPLRDLLPHMVRL